MHCDKARTVVDDNVRASAVQTAGEQSTLVRPQTAKDPNILTTCPANPRKAYSIDDEVVPRVCVKTPATRECGVHVRSLHARVSAIRLLGRCTPCLPYPNGHPLPSVSTSSPAAAMPAIFLL